MQHIEAMINCYILIKYAITQKRPNKKYHITYSVSGPHWISAMKDFSLKMGSPTEYKKMAVITQYTKKIHAFMYANKGSHMILKFELTKSEAASIMLAPRLMFFQQQQIKMA